MKNRYWNGVLSALLLALLMLSGCRMFEKDAMGEPAYILGLAVCGDQVWHLAAAENGRDLLRDGKTVLKGLEAAQFDRSGSACLYRAEGKLVRYDLAEGTDREIAPADPLLGIPTEDYLLVDDRRIAMADGSVTQLKNKPQGSFAVLTVRGNRVYMDHTYRRTIAIYDAQTDTRTDLWQYAPEFNDILAGALVEGKLYFSRSTGGLWQLDPKTPGVMPVQVSKRTPVAMALGESGLICALAGQEKSLIFCTGLEQDQPLEIARWEGAGYYLNGSCRLALSGTKAACAVSTGQEVFVFEVK